MEQSKQRYLKPRALKELEEAFYQQKLQTCSMPSYAVPKPKFDERSSNGLTKCIIAYISLLGGWATRVNTTGRYLHGEQVTNVIGQVKQLKGRWIPGTTNKGTPDIIGNLKGLFLGIEVKIGKDTQSDEQKNIQNQIEESGGLYIIARSFEQFKNVIDKHFNHDQQSTAIR